MFPLTTINNTHGGITSSNNYRTMDDSIPSGKEEKPSVEIYWPPDINDSDEESTGSNLSTASPDKVPAPSPSTDPRDDRDLGTLPYKHRPGDESSTTSKINQLLRQLQKLKGEQLLCFIETSSKRNSLQSPDM